MQKSEEWNRELLGLVLLGEFSNFLKQRGISFLDVFAAPHRQRNRIFDEFNDGLGKVRKSKPKSGRPKKRDAESIAEFTRMIDKFKSDYRKRYKKNLSDNNLLDLLQQHYWHKHEITPLNVTVDALAQRRKSVRNQMSVSRQVPKT